MLVETGRRQNLRLDRSPFTHRLDLFRQLIDSLFACAGNRLICRYHYPLDPRPVMNRFQRHHHDDCRTVRIGDDPLVIADSRRIDFRHHQRHIRVHAECAGIVNHHRARFHRMRRKLLAGSSAGEQRDVDSGERIGSGFFHNIFLAGHHQFFAGRAGRRQ